MKKRYIVCITFLALLLLTGIHTKTTAENIDDLKAQREQITNELSQVNEDLENIHIELTQELEALNKLEGQIEEQEAEVAKTNENLKKIQEDIDKVETKLEYVEKDYNKQKDILTRRIVAMYESGETTYLDVLLNSKNITDFISNYYIIGEIASYDKDLLDNIEREKNSIEQIKNNINAKKEELKLAQKAQEKTLIALENSKTIRKSYASTLTKEEQDVQEKINGYKTKLNTLDSQILFLTLGTIDSDFVGGEFMWPAPGYTTITSPFGTRFHPIYKTYSTHHGLDIGAPMGSYVVAANSGVVTTASYLSIYGNAVIIDHGGGVSTIYAHGSELLVSVGDKVEKGDFIMKAGSTGLSTGPHLHFGISINGQYVDPLPYLTNSNNTKNNE